MSLVSKENQTTNEGRRAALWFPENTEEMKTVMTVIEMVAGINTVSMFPVIPVWSVNIC